MQLPTPARCVPSVTNKSLFLHLLAFSWSCFGIYCDRNYYALEKFNEYGGRFIFLTMITAYANLLAHGFAFLVDIIQKITGLLEDQKITKNGYRAHNSVLIALRDDLVTFWSATLSIFVVLMYWGIAAVDLDGLHPPEDRKIVKLFGWYNQYLHTIPLPVVLILLTNVNYGYGSFIKAVTYTILLGSSYMAWVVHLADVRGYWVYPFMAKQTRFEFIVFFVFCHVVFFIVYYISRRISKGVWSQEYKERVIIEAERKGL